MNMDKITNTVRQVAVQMGVMSAFVAVDETVRTFVKEKVRPFVRVRDDRSNH
jgi:hypothetical protein